VTAQPLIVNDVYRTHDDPALARAHQQVIAARPEDSAIQAFFDAATNTVSYVVHDPQTRHATILDSVLDYDPASGRTTTKSVDTLCAYVERHQLTVEWLLETHVHADHLSGAQLLKSRLGGRVAIGEHIVAVQRTFGPIFNAGADFTPDGSDFDRLWRDGDPFQLGRIAATVLHVPGHTPACVAYVIGDAVFVGDTVFLPDYGTARTDFPGGSARELYRSMRRLFALPPRTRVFVCHDYLPASRREYAWETTVDAERTGNVHVREGVSEADFVALRESRDSKLSMPRLILPSIQVNMRAGRLPAAESNGIAYLKLPLNAV
jgi:glyoxylase-like metal-dependent hydrolase (beta-lactamase superfamily II)